MNLKTVNLSLTHTNQDKAVLNDISLNFDENKLYLLLGPSGCGKSSLANVLAGIIPNNISGKITGDVLFDDYSILQKQTYEISLKVGYVMQDADSQFCTYKVEDELLFGLENLKYSKKEMDIRLNRILDLMNIKDIRYKSLNSLSGGQKQKVAIASVLILDPPVVIFDEPTANLDPATSKEIFQLINKIKCEYKKTIIIIEHKLDYLIEYVDYVYILSNNGMVDSSGTPKEVFRYLLDTNKRPEFHYPQIIDLWKAINAPYEDISFNLKDCIKYIKDKYFYKNSNTEYNVEKLNSKILEAQNIRYKVNDSQIINDLSFEVEKGDFMAIVGQNGAGKSTIASILLNLNKNYQGNIIIDGKLIKSYKRKDLWHKAGLVFQNPEWQFISYNVSDELKFSLKDIKLDKNEEEKCISECLERFKLLEYKDYNPYLLSQGQKRRLSVATMLITGQDILILDEPTYGQDYDNQTELLEYLSELNKEGITIIIITHDMDLVVNYCNKVMVMKDGNSLYYGDNKTLFENDKIIDEAKLLRPIFLEVLKEMNVTDNFPKNLSELAKKLVKRDDKVERNDE